MSLGFWIFMFVMNLLTPLLMLGFGYKSLKNPPKEINGVYGYVLEGDCHNHSGRKCTKEKF